MFIETSSLVHLRSCKPCNPSPRGASSHLMTPSAKAENMLFQPIARDHSISALSHRGPSGYQSTHSTSRITRGFFPASGLPVVYCSLTPLTALMFSYYQSSTLCIQILPIENKLRHPEEFTRNCGVLPTLMILITVFYTALGFFGYTAYGENTLGTLPLNMPDTT